MKIIFSIIVCVMLCLGVRAGTIDSAGYDTNVFVISKTAGTVTLNTNSSNPKAAATKGDLAYALSLSNMVYRAAFDANGAATAATNASPFLLNRMSPPGGNNEYADMRTASNAYAGPALGVSYPGGNPSAWLWAANTNGLGSNVWGIPINFPGGIQTFGNRYWQDLPKSPLSDPFSGEDHFIGMGPAASSFGAAFINGTNFGPQQPVFNYIWGNPYVGAALICIRGAFTNSIHGVFAGNTSNGVPVYISQFGLAIGEITDAYSIPDNGMGLTQRGSDAQQTPSIQLGLGSDYTLDDYISLNGVRGGDHLDGQIPLMAIQTTNLYTTGDILWGIPKQVADVWMIKQPGWLWALVGNERTGDVAVTNGTFQVSKILADQATNNGAIVFGRPWDISAPFNINTPVSVNIPGETFGFNGAWTFDASAAHRIGFVLQNGQYPHLAHGSGAPFIISQYGVSDLQTIHSATPVGTNEFTINPDSSLTFIRTTNVDSIELSNRLDIYSLNTDSSNYRRGSLYFSGADFYVEANAAGTGASSGNLALAALENHSIQFRFSGVSRYFLATNGFNPTDDNLRDLGSSGSRWKGAYFGGNITANSFIGDGGSISGLHDTNIVVATNNWNWPGPTNSLDWARGTLQRYHPSDTTPLSITNFVNFPAGQVASMVLWVENTNTSALSVKLPSPCEATNSLGGLTVSVNASNRLQILFQWSPLSTNALFSDQQLIK